MGNTASIPYTREKARALPSLSPSSLFSPIRKSSPSPPVDPPPPIHLLTSGPPQLTAPPNSKIRAKRRKNLGFQILSCHSGLIPTKEQLVPVDSTYAFPSEHYNICNVTFLN
ncbi:hypothetical protein V6Z12_D13G214900 [Gossypium hirsutum]